MKRYETDAQMDFGYIVYSSMAVATQIECAHIKTEHLPDIALEQCIHRTQNNIVWRSCIVNSHKFKIL